MCSASAVNTRAKSKIASYRSLSFTHFLSVSPPNRSHTGLSSHHAHCRCGTRKRCKASGPSVLPLRLPPKLIPSCHHLRVHSRCSCASLLVVVHGCTYSFYFFFVDYTCNVRHSPDAQEGLVQDSAPYFLAKVCPSVGRVCPSAGVSWRRSSVRPVAVCVCMCLECMGGW